MHLPSTQKLKQFIALIDGFSEWVGRGISWLTLLLVALTFLVVVARYAFNLGSIALQESQLYLHSIVFLLGAAYTFKHDGHVRVDIFYRPLTATRKAWVNLLGVLLLLLPAAIFIFVISWQYVASSWSYFEGSREADGLDAVYLLKTLLLAMPVLVILQGVAEALRSLLIITGRITPESTDEGASL